MFVFADIVFVVLLGKAIHKNTTSVKVKVGLLSACNRQSKTKSSALKANSG